MDFKDRIILFIICILIIIFTVGFIFHGSSQKYSIESSESKTLAQEVDQLIIAIRGDQERPVDQIELIIRKSAHLIEYTIFGTIVFLAVFVNIKNIIIGYLLILGITLPVPFIDEFIIQAKTLGRGVHYLDVGIDLVGILLAILIGSIYLLAFHVFRVRSGKVE